MYELSTQQIIQVSGGHLVTAALVGTGLTYLGWASIAHIKGITHILYELDNYLIVGSMGAVVGSAAYLAGTII